MIQIRLAISWNNNSFQFSFSNAARGTCTLRSKRRHFRDDIDFPLCSKPRPTRRSIDPASTHLSLHGTRKPTFASLSYPAVDLPFLSSSPPPSLRFARSYDLLKNVRLLRTNPFHPRSFACRSLIRVRELARALQGKSIPPLAAFRLLSINSIDTTRDERVTSTQPPLAFDEQSNPSCQKTLNRRS